MSEAVQLPEPGGVAGVDRHGDLLVSLDDSCLPMVDAIGATAATLWRAGLGRTHPAGESIFKRMIAPQPGDLVVVRDSIAHRDPDTRRRGLGYLVTVRAEFATTRSVWEREIRDGEVDPDLDQRRVEREAFYVQYGPAPADVCRWTNCDVLALPAPGSQWWKA
jgi:hypothetical protein